MQLGVSTQTAYRMIAKASSHIVNTRRKRRCDAGGTALSKDEALTIAAYLKASTRRNGKVLASVQAALDVLRNNGAIRAERVDKATGEIMLLSPSAVLKALRVHGCHPGQIEQPTPHIGLRSLHPNHCWQIDPSLCVLYRLQRELGLRSMPHDQFYKNRPDNLARVENERVWRYVITDHTTGALYVEYVHGAESAANLSQCFINAMQYRGASDPFCGVPKLVMADQGSANKSAPFQNLCAALGVEIWLNQPGNPRAKGGVEKGNDLVEREFESGLAFLRVDSLEELNVAAWRWMRRWNAERVHTRHGMTRYAAWSRITAEQFRFAPAAEVCRAFAMSAPVERLVRADLRVSWNGKLFDVSRVPEVVVGQKITLARNAWDDENSAQVLDVDADGRQVRHIVPRVAKGEFGFYADDAVLGDFKRHADTPVDANRKAIERKLMDATTDAEAEQKRKGGALPFGGRIDPYKEIAQTPDVAWLPRFGTPSDVAAPQVNDLRVQGFVPQPIRAEFAPLDHVEAAMRLKPLVEQAGATWTPDMYARTAARWPDGVPHDQIETWAAELAAPGEPARGGLRVISGGAA